ncbi:hypothetical protein PVAND_016309 [Polypedilum vanderplanki]|uniref:Leucine rich repeat protein n=1 Tax=Polypedilum vanderplanki TaxID=319348 RepID=A0A9J6BFG7_POLVA|nr:hypothetical protein PVAND_016309 [Polypedilum vanderplanki]
MPQGLNKIFPNLIFICIYKDHMKEIDQKDLEQYPKLKGLDLETNDIEYLEKDLFKFNTELQYLHFGNNKISQIHPTIFDHLNKLEYLELQGNQCINKGNTGRSGVLELIKEVKEKCLPEILFVFKQLQTLNETINNNFKSIKNQLNEKSLKISNLELKNENMINLMNKNIQVLSQI